MSTPSQTTALTDAGRRGRHAAARQRGSFARSLLGAVPVVLVSSLALTLGTTPGDATARKTDRDRGPSPDSSDTGHLDFSEAEAPVVDAVVTPIEAATAPAQTMAPFEYTVVEGDTVSDIAGRFGLSTASVLALNGLSWKSMIFPGQTLSLNASASPTLPVETPLTRYTIAPGDTVGSIAERHGMDTGAVLSANGLGRDSIIYAGQSIVIPQIISLTTPAPTLDATPVASVTPIGSSVILSDEMYANAARIVRIGRELGVGDRGIVIGLAAAMQESSLRNISWGHLDSVGLFQQRPSTGWGTVDEILDPEYAIRTFFTGIHTEETTILGLLDVPGWESMSLTEAAQAVQISAYPNAYAQWERDAWSWLSAIG